MACMSTRATRLFTLAVLAGAATMLVTACAPTGEPATPPTSTADSNDATADVATEIVGLWRTDSTGEPHLEFTADGDVRGSDGCNGITTTYSIDGETIDVASFASTLKACKDVDGWLRSVRAVEIDGDVLVVMNSAGEQIGELNRAE